MNDSVEALCNSYVFDGMTHDRKLFKYYNDNEERDERVPDILDFLYDKRDAFYDELDQIVSEEKTAQANLAQSSNSPTLYEKFTLELNGLEHAEQSQARHIELLTKTIKRVEEERAEYYYVYRGLKIVPILAAKYPVKLITAVNGKLVMKDSGVSVEVYEVPTHDNKGVLALLPVERDPSEFPRVSYREHPLGYYTYYAYREGVGYVGYEGVENIQPTNMYTKCSSCGLIFPLTEEHQEWYAERKFDLPKRCSACRKEKRDMKESCALSSYFT